MDNHKLNDIMIEKAINNTLEDIRKKQLEYEEYNANEEERRKEDKINRKLAVYNELLQNISSENLLNSIAEAKIKNKNYVVLNEVAFVMLECYITARKKLVYEYDPYGKGSIYDLLLKSVPDECKIHVDEPWSMNDYEFKLYISWNKLSIKDKYKLWKDDGVEKFMQCDIHAYHHMIEDLSYQRTMNKLNNKLNKNLLSTKETRI